MLEGIEEKSGKDMHSFVDSKLPSIQYVERSQKSLIILLTGTYWFLEEVLIVTWSIGYSSLFGEILCTRLLSHGRRYLIDNLDAGIDKDESENML